MGQVIAQWAVDRGARNLIIMSRSIASSNDAIEISKQLEANGCKVKLCSCDATDGGSLSEALAECRRDMPPIRGVIQGAVVLDVRYEDTFLFLHTITNKDAGFSI